MKKTVLLIFVLFYYAQLFSQSADSLMKKGLLRQAIKQYKKEISDTNESQNLAQIAVAYEYLNKRDSALYFHYKAINTKPQSCTAFTSIIEFFLTDNQTDSMLKYINLGLEKFPRNSMLTMFYGLYNILSDKNDSAYFLLKKAIQLNKKNHKAYFNLAYIFTNNQNYDSALFFINKALALKKFYSYYKLKADILYQQQRYSDALDQIDSALSLEKKDNLVKDKIQILLALNEYKEIINLLKPYLNENYDQTYYYYTIISYYNLGLYDSALTYISIAKQIDTQNDLYYYITGEIYLNQKKYNDAYLQYINAIELNPSDGDYFLEASYAKLMSNTKSEVFNIENKFIKFNQSNWKLMIKLSKNKKSQYNYNLLLSKFNFDPTSLSLDEYFMLYFGSALQKNFNPYQNFSMSIAQAYDNENYTDCINLSINFLKTHPISIGTYFYLANAYYNLGKYKQALKYIIIYYGFMKAINYAGDGKSIDSPFIITTPNDIILMLQYLGYTYAGHKVIKKNKKHYDVVNYIYNNKNYNIYFNIELMQK